MSGRWRAAFAALALLSSWPGAEAADHAADSGRTTTLTRETFDDYIKERKAQKRHCIVMFHVDWCKVCQRTFPKFAKASELVYDKDAKMDFAHVDCTNDKTLCQRFNVKGYPTIKLFGPTGTDADAMSYRGQRTEDAFLKYAERMTRPPVLALKSAADLAAKLENETLVSFVAADASREPPAGLLAAAKRWQDLHVFAAAPRLADLLPKSVTPPAGATLAVLSSGAQQWPGRDNTSQANPVATYYIGSLDDVDAVTKWVERNRFPGIWSLDMSNFFFFTHANRSAALVAVDPSSMSSSQEKSLREAAARLADDYIFGVVDGVAWADELADFNVHKQDLPRVFVAEEDFDKWVEDIEALRFEKLESDLRSLAEGAPLLRQDRGTFSRLFFYKREAVRFAAKARAFAGKGPKQAVLVAIACILALVVVGLFGYVVLHTCWLLFQDDMDPLPEERTRAAHSGKPFKKD